jgi:hypothetical protein
MTKEKQKSDQKQKYQLLRRQQVEPCASFDVSLLSKMKGQLGFQYHCKREIVIFI